MALRKKKYCQPILENIKREVGMEDLAGPQNGIADAVPSNGNMSGGVPVQPHLKTPVPVLF